MRRAGARRGAIWQTWPRRPRPRGRSTLPCKCESGLGGVWVVVIGGMSGGGDWDGGARGGR